jgi:OmpA-OmpF porin, OOP family
MQHCTRWFFLLLVVGTSIQAYGQDRFSKDIAGGKDHLLISRYEGAKLFNFGIQNYAQLEIIEGKRIYDKDKIKPEKSRLIEGAVSNYLYFAAKDRSPLEIFRNYEASLTKAGFKTLYSCRPKLGQIGNLARWLRPHVID